MTGKLQIACRVCGQRAAEIGRESKWKSKSVGCRLRRFFFGAEKCATVLQLAKREKEEGAKRGIISREKNENNRKRRVRDKTLMEKKMEDRDR